MALIEGADIDGYMPLGLGAAVREAAGPVPDAIARSADLTMVARLRPDVTLATAQAAVDVVARRLADQYPETEKDTTARVMPGAAGAADADGLSSRISCR